MLVCKRSRWLFLVLFVFLPGFLLADLAYSVKKHDISLNYLNKEIVKGIISVDCSEQSSCQSTVEFEKSDNNKFSSSPYHLGSMKFHGHFYWDSKVSSELGSITVQKNSRETRIPLTVNYEGHPLGDKDNPITRALIAHLHPSLIHHAIKELEQITEISDYLAGEVKNSETLHLFKPEPHKLSLKESENLANSVNGEFIVLDIGESYSMVIIFNPENIPVSIYVLDRWKLYRDPIFKTIIGYGDLVGLVLHGMDFIKHTGSMFGLGAHSHGHSHEVVTASSFVANKLTSFVGAGFHIAEIVDHTHGVGEFINGGQKHYHTHHHSIWTDAFGIMHIGHTLFEMITDPSLAHGIQTVLTFASFGYHHVPHHYYEYSMFDVLHPVFSSTYQPNPDANHHPVEL